MRCPSGRCRRFHRSRARRRAKTLAVVSRSSCRPSGTLYLDRKKSLTLRRGLPHGTCLLLQLAPDFWKSLAAPIADQHLDLLRDRFSFFEYGNSHMLAYLVPGELEAIEPGKRRYNWVWYRNAAENRLADLLIDAAGRQRASSIPPGLLSAASETDLRWRHGPSFRPASNAVCSTAKWSPAARSRSSGQIRSVWHPS